MGCNCEQCNKPVQLPPNPFASMFGKSRKGKRAVDASLDGSVNSRGSSSVVSRASQSTAQSAASARFNGKSRVQDISNELIPITGRKPLAFVIHDLLSPRECASLISRSEKAGYDSALIQGPGGRQILRKDIRHCGRCIIDDDELARTVYAKILDAIEGNAELENKVRHAPWVTGAASGDAAASLDSSYSTRESGVSSSTAGDGNGGAANKGPTLHSAGLNERMRFLRYTPGHFFAPHQDLHYTRGPEFGDRQGETSYVTVQLYLNDKFKGGTTRFLSGKRYYDVKPRAGSALIFDHDILHEGSKVVGGIKYSVRTDIMFTSAPVVGRFGDR